MSRLASLWSPSREETVATKSRHSLAKHGLALAAIAFAAAALPALAADVTPERLFNTAAEPQNWLMVHHDYNNSRHSLLTDVNRGNVKDLKLKFIFSIGGRSTGGTLPGKEESTPLVDDGFMYVSDTYD